MTLHWRLAAGGGMEDDVKVSQRLVGIALTLVVVLVAERPAPAQPTASTNPCPLTVEQVAAVTGTAMTRTGVCTFFPANGRDIPRVFCVLQTPMVCKSIKPGELGFTEAVVGLPAEAAYVKDQLDGAHVLVCRNNGRAFDIVVEIKRDRAQNREIAIGLARQVLAGR